jgi:hypothetical protein
MVLDPDLDPVVGREVLAAERVGREGRLADRDEPVRMLDDPARIEAHVVGDHVARKSDAAGRGSVAEHGVGGVAAEVVGDPVVVEGVRARDRLLVAAPALDRLRRLRPLPQPDQPEAR